MNRFFSEAAAWSTAAGATFELSEHHHRVHKAD